LDDFLDSDLHNKVLRRQVERGHQLTDLDRDLVLAPNMKRLAASGNSMGDLIEPEPGSTARISSERSSTVPYSIPVRGLRSLFRQPGHNLSAANSHSDPIPPRSAPH
jgi:hypothetical protein